jgi:hypothetical protein
MNRAKLAGLLAAVFVLGAAIGWTAKCGRFAAAPVPPEPPAKIIAMVPDGWGGQTSCLFAVEGAYIGTDIQPPFSPDEAGVMLFYARPDHRYETLVYRGRPAPKP